MDRRRPWVVTLTSYVPGKFIWRCSKLKLTMFIIAAAIGMLVLVSQSGLHSSAEPHNDDEKSLSFPQHNPALLPLNNQLQGGGIEGLVPGTAEMTSHDDEKKSGMTSRDHVTGRRRQCSPDAPTNIVFIKVHKAGSSTVSNMLARYALNHDLNIALPEQKPMGDVFHCFGPFFEYRVLPLAEGQTPHVLFNHMIYNRTALNRVMPSDAFYVAIMREPVTRFLSGVYYFGRLRPPARNDTDNEAFKRFIGPESRAKLERNFRVYNSFAWNTGLPLEEQKKPESVRRHLERLDRELGLVMVMEHFLESLVLFKRTACLTTKDIVFMKINTRRSYNVHRMTEEDLSTLRSWQRADHMAWDHFMDKFRRLVRQQGPDFRQEVDHFRRVTERVTSYCSGSRPRFDVLVIHRSEWNEEFSLNSADCAWMKSDERELQRLLLTRARDRRDSQGYRERRNPVPQWKSDC